MSKISGQSLGRFVVWSKSVILDKLDGIEARYEELGRLMSDPDALADYGLLKEYGQERAELEAVVEAYRRHKALSRELEGARSLADSDEPDMAAMAADEVARLEQAQSAQWEELRRLLLPRDPNDDKNVIVEIRAGTGGEEAALFGAELLRMYSRYAEMRHWKVELLSANETGIGGYKEVIVMIKGQGAYSRLKYESGVHRVQRVPVTESSGRIHTSTATVAVLPEVDEVEIAIPEKDIEMEVYKSAGAGGQNVQKNSTAVRLRHLPTGMVVQCQDERSQLQNRLRAMAVLRARLYDIEQNKRDQETIDERRSQIGQAFRSEKIRTYNFPQSRITDHRIDQSYYAFKMQSILNGDLDEVIDELATQDQAERLQAVGI
ncbi:MAG: peptide chain release factor 1 [Thermoflexales bacterium]|nr:peptide chain release factor 1 [Thermoflexales bacterium]